MSTAPLVVLVTGEPVSKARQARGDFATLIQSAVGDAWDGPWSTVDLRQGDELPRAGEMAGVIVTGSAAFLADGAPWMLRGVDYLAHLTVARVPVFGICFGHQMLAAALGGRVARNPRGREIGTVALHLEPGESAAHTMWFSGAQPPVWVHTTHLDSAVELPIGARVLARTALEPHALVQFAERAWGVQFHPEMDEAVMRCYIEERGGSLAAEGIEAQALLSAVRATPESRATLRRFAAYCRELSREPGAEL